MISTLIVKDEKMYCSAAGTKLKRGMGVSHPTTLKMLFCRAKMAVKCIFWGNLLEPGPFDQLMSLKTRSQKTLPNSLVIDLIFLG